MNESADFAVINAAGQEVLIHGSLQLQGDMLTIACVGGQRKINSNSSLSRSNRCMPQMFFIGCDAPDRKGPNTGSDDMVAYPLTER